MGWLYRRNTARLSTGGVDCWCVSVWITVGTAHGAKLSRWVAKNSPQMKAGDDQVKGVPALSPSTLLK